MTLPSKFVASSEEKGLHTLAATELVDRYRRRLLSPVDVAAIAFEDDARAVRMLICNQNDRSRNVAIEFRGRMIRRSIEAGAMVELSLDGEARLRDALPPAALVPEPAGA